MVDPVRVDQGLVADLTVGDDPAVQVALALLVIDRVFAFVRQMKGKSNGHAEVRPKDAIEFYVLQTGMDSKLDELLRLARKRTG